jgi:hypothetical protein
MAWFRMQDTVLDDPKVQRLPDKAFRGWVNLLCLAKRNGGVLPAVADIAFALRATEKFVHGLIETLVAAELIDRTDAGLTPHNWTKWQYESDVSTTRVKRFRERHRNVSETQPETPPEQSRAETDSETEQKQSRADPREVGETVLAIMAVADDPRWVGSYGRVHQWLADGCDPELDIYPTIRRVMAKRNGQGPPANLKYFDQAIADAKATRLTPLPRGQPGVGKKSDAELMAEIQAAKATAT